MWEYTYHANEFVKHGVYVLCVVCVRMRKVSLCLYATCCNFGMRPGKRGTQANFHLILSLMEADPLPAIAVQSSPSLGEPYSVTIGESSRACVLFVVARS